MLGFMYTFYPVMQIYLFPPDLPCHPERSEGSLKNSKDSSPDPQNDNPCKKIYKDDFAISIPKIHAYAPIIKNVDPLNQKIYNEALKKGVAHAKNTSFPGEKGTIYLFAHSSGSPWELTRFNTIFLRLGELKKGDEVFIDYEGKLYTFTITDRKEIWPTETKYLENTKKDQLIIQTCTPIGTSLKRLLVFAKQK